MGARRAWGRLGLASVMVAGVLAIAGSPAGGSHTPDPTSVAIVGSLQSELGCPGDWQPECAATELGYDSDDDKWQVQFNVPAGNWEYKAALDDAWDENYGAGGVQDGANIALDLGAATDVKFYYDHETHWVTDNVNSTIATVAGNFQSALGCPGDWDPGCLRSWMQDPDGDGVYSFVTTEIPAGDYEFKVALDEDWATSYPAGNVPVTVPGAGDAVSITFDTATNGVAVSVGGLEPGDELLATPPVRHDSTDEFVYFVMPDRFENGDPGNDAGGDPSGDPLVNGLDPTDKGFYHGGDLAGLEAKLPYLDDLGVTALWITPPFKNRWVQSSGSDTSAGYHGYWQIDFSEIDPHFGTNAEMVSVVTSAHARGMKVYFDIVTNHTGDVITFVEGDNPSYVSKDDQPFLDALGVPFDDRDYAGTGTFPPLDPAVSFPYTPTFGTTEDETVKFPDFLDDPTLYHNRGNSTFAGESSLYGDFFGLDDLFTEHPVVVDGMTQIHKDMISDFDIDGFRVDTVKHVNDEFWESFLPEIEAHAAGLGKDDFTVFGEVFSGDPEFVSRFSTELPFPSTLDFRFDEKVRSAVSAGNATAELRTLFADDDWFTDADSNASALHKFVGNHDRGRVGHYIDADQPGASDSERVGRATLAQALNFFSRGTPVIYYGDEQGFTGSGGDKDARQDMFPSSVADYNDDDLIGTAATTADDNFDTTHPLFQLVSDFAALRDAHPAFRTGAQLHRYSEGSDGIYAFSRIDRTEQVEYLVAVNTSESARSATFSTDTPGAAFTEIWPGTGPSISAGASGAISVDVPALDVVVYRADSPVPTDTTPDGIAVTSPAPGASVFGRTEVAADVSPGTYAEVTFAVSVDGAPYEVLGVDDNAPYRVFHDVSGLPVGAEITYKAIVRDLGDNLNAAKVSALVGEPPVAETGDHAIIHYLRDAGDYGDHTTGDYDDFWGLHLWGDITETIEWTSPKPFLGETEYGRFAWVPLTDGASDVGFIVHKGDTKDTDPDRFFDPSVDREIWLRQGDETIYTSQADAQGHATIRYHRDDGDYGTPSPDYTTFWGLHLWGDAIDPAAGTDWTSPRPPDGVDDFGAYWNVPLADAGEPLNFIIHRGDTKDPGPDQSFVPEEQATAWINSGDETIHGSQGAATETVTIHYHRPAGDYGDPASPDYNDFWGLHTWGDAADPGWTTPRTPANFDVFGAVFDVPLIGGKSQIGYILHRGDEKDPGPDQALVVGEDGYEVWQLQGMDPPDGPYLYPLEATGPVSRGDLSEQRAYWVDEDTILWPAATEAGADYRLHYAPTGGLALTDEGVDGSSVVLTPGAADPAVFDKFPHLTGTPALKIDAGDLAMVPDLLKGQVAVAMSDGGLRLDATGLQLPGVLDELYANARTLGVSWAGDVPTARLWAPTAKNVNLLVHPDSDPATPPTSVPMAMAADGVWEATGDATWGGKYYLYEVEVYVPSTDGVETNLVTDPYSTSLAMNSTRSQFVDLSADALRPAGWDSLAKPELTNPEDISIYELHVRDFSANDTTVPADEQGTFAAFTESGSDGMAHLSALADAGLSHLHLLPVFDIATVNENRAEWQAPDPAELATYAPDSDQQQAAVVATEDLDGFNWGYDPLHYTVPEGSYSTDPDGTTRIVEFREMVAALNETGLRVVMDVVYNHTHASGQNDQSVLDRIVPGYYHRLDDAGVVETSTCCANTATEHAMMEKLMIDSVVTWARDHKVDGFRFDLMGHHSKASMLKLRAELDDLTLADDGVDGSSIYLYGEGWNFGEVADGARFEQATQLNMAGTGIGTFNDRDRDAVRGGGPFDGGDSLVTNQGLINGLYYDPNELVQPNDPSGPSVADQLDELLLSADQVRVGLAGNLADYEFEDRTGNTVTGKEVDYNGSPTGYTQDPQEDITYVSAHDNQTLFDISQYKHPLGTSMKDRVRAQNLGMDYTVLGQGVPFLHAGVDMLRSKSMDRDSYNSGDWFNTLDFTYQDNNWAVGLPVAGKNGDNWPLIGPRLADPALDPASGDIEASVEHLQEILEIRQSTPLFRLTTGALVDERVGFHNTGPSQVPGLVVMTVDDPGDEPGSAPLPSGDLDPETDQLIVLFNATDTPVSFPLTSLVGNDHVTLHEVQQSSADPVVQTALFDSTTGTFEVPARTTAVFVDPWIDEVPPEAGAELERLRGNKRSGVYRVHAMCADNVPEGLMTTADINGVPVEDGDVVKLYKKNWDEQKVFTDPGKWAARIFARDFTLTVTCTDAAGNEATATAEPVFAKPNS